MPSREQLDSHPLTLWLAVNAVDHHDFAERIGVSKQTLWRWRCGATKPSKGFRRRIQKLTRGAVPASIWSDDNAA